MEDQELSQISKEACKDVLRLCGKLPAALVGFAALLTAMTAVLVFFERLPYDRKPVFLTCQSNCYSKGWETSKYTIFNDNPVGAGQYQPQLSFGQVPLPQAASSPATAPDTKEPYVSVDSPGWANQWPSPSSCWLEPKSMPAFRGREFFVSRSINAPGLSPETALRDDKLVCVPLLHRTTLDYFGSVLESRHAWIKWLLRIVAALLAVAIGAVAWVHFARMRFQTTFEKSVQQAVTEGVRTAMKHIRAELEAKYRK